MDEVYVVEIAATGPKGVPKDTVAEVAVCRVLGDGSDFDTVYWGRVALDPLDLGKEPLDYLQENYGITAESLYSGDPQEEVVKGFQDAVFGQEVTSYSVGSTFGKFLSFEPWDTAREVTVLPSYSAVLPEKCSAETVPGSIEAAYSVLCPGDSAGFSAEPGALRLAHMSASVVALLRREGFFRGSPEPYPDHAAQEGVYQASDVHQGVQDEQRYRHEGCYHRPEYRREDADGQGEGGPENQEADAEHQVALEDPMVKVYLSQS